MSTNITPDMLIQYLDDELAPDQRLVVDTELAASPALQQQLERLRLSRQAFVQFARREQVSAVHRQFMKENRSQSKLVKINWLRTTMRVAAILIVTLLVAGIVQYSLLDADRLYNSHYETYTLGTTRANETVSEIEQAYRNGQLPQVKKLYEAADLSKHSPADHFLAAQAYLALGNMQKAIAAFENQLSANASLSFKPYQDDAEYYLALAYVKTGNTARALPLLEKIHRQPSHTYHEQVSGWFIQKVRWLRSK